MSYYPEPDSFNRKKVKVELHLPNYATKSDAKFITNVDTSKFSTNSDLAGLKLEINELVIEKLKNETVDLSKVSDAVKDDVDGKTVYEELVKYINAVDAIDVSNLV